MSSILVMTSDPKQSEAIRSAIGRDTHSFRHVADEQAAIEALRAMDAELLILDLAPPATNGIALLRKLRQNRPGLKCIVLLRPESHDQAIGALREHVCDFLMTPIVASELRAVVDEALTTCAAAQVEVVSSIPQWVELRVPCDFGAMPVLEKTLLEMEAELPEELRQAIAYAFREMLNNAVEYGCRLDRSQRIEVRYVRLQRAIVCWIKDPGPGFDPARLKHAAISNPAEDPIHHLTVRNEQGLRPGGFGILMTEKMVDELVYNESHNELMFIKYLS